MPLEAPDDRHSRQHLGGQYLVNGEWVAARHETDTGHVKGLRPHPGAVECRLDHPGIEQSISDEIDDLLR